MKLGTVIDDRYEILKEIGRGGMSIVYLAMDNRLNKSLAIKDIRKRENSNNELLLNSLIVEANMLKKLDHGSLPKIYDIIESEGDIYVVMDYVEGESLKEKLNREKKIAVDEVIDWASQLSDVLGYLHTRKPHPIIYRDMKPDNIMLTPDGKIKLIDFGIAREYKQENETDTTNLGTKAYAAPEQMAGKQTDERTDIYSLGVTLYHLVTGKSLNEAPFEIRPIRTWDSSLPEGLEYIIQKCTQAEPGERYQSCRELSLDLQNIHKLTKGYKDKLYKQLFLFLIPVMLCIASFVTAIVGYNGIQNEQFRDYKGLINEASRYLLNKEDEKAIEQLEKAITTVDNKRAEAYINLLDVYIGRNETDTGLAKIEAYINEEYGNIQKNSDVLFKLAMTFFNVKKDYISAANYFKMVDVGDIPAAKYYQSISQTMGVMNVDYKAFHKELQDFEKYNDNTADDERKIDNYNSLANIYLSYKGQIPDANSQSIQLIEKAQNTLDKLENERLQVKYEVEFQQKLAQAYYSRGVSANDKETARTDFEQAIEHYNNLLTLEVTNEEDVRLKISQIYYAMGEIPQAIEILNESLKKYPTSISIHVKLGNLFLDIEQTKEEGKRSYSQAKNIYLKATNLKGAKEDESLKKLARRLQNLKVI
ncbi:MAG: protein kinase [Bacillaceae bacterium]